MLSFSLCSVRSLWRLCGSHAWGLQLYRNSCAHWHTKHTNIWITCHMLELCINIRCGNKWMNQYIRGFYAYYCLMDRRSQHSFYCGCKHFMLTYRNFQCAPFLYRTNCFFIWNLFCSGRNAREREMTPSQFVDHHFIGFSGLFFFGKWISIRVLLHIVSFQL